VHEAEQAQGFLILGVGSSRLNRLRCQSSLLKKPEGVAMNQAKSIPISLNRKGFLALALTLFAIAYNISVIPPIMPKIVREFNSSMGYIQGALVLFSLVTASFAPTIENLCNYYGRKRIFIYGLVLYSIGITLTALSPDMGALVVFFSLLTGLAATPLISTPWAITDMAFDGKIEEQATLALILASTLGGLTGIMAGGFLASKVGWRWAFLPSLIVLLVILVLRRSLPDTAIPRNEPVDWVGGLFSFLGLGCILVGIGLAGEYGWWAPKQTFSIAGVVIPPFALSIVPTLMAVGAICLGFFAFWQRKQANKSGASLLRMGILKKRVFVLGTLTAMLHTLVTTGVQFNLYQFIPQILKLNPIQTSLAVMPYTLTMLIVLVALLRFLTIDDKFPPKYVVLTGITLLGLGVFLLYNSFDDRTTALSFLPGLISMGMGSGIFLAYIASLTYSVASTTEKPEGSAIYNPVQNLGSSLGRGILGTILISFTAQEIVSDILKNLGRQLSPVQRQEAVNYLTRAIQTFSSEERKQMWGKLPASVQPSLDGIFYTAAVNGMRTSLLIALGLSILCLLLATVLPKYPRRQRT
jgi:MFS family permease